MPRSDPIPEGGVPDLQTQYERAFMQGELDPFDFQLAEALGMTVQRMRDTISNQEYLQWRAFYVYRDAQEKLAATPLKAVPRG